MPKASAPAVPEASSPIARKSVTSGKGLMTEYSRESLVSPGIVTDAAKVIIKALREQVPELQPSSPLSIRFDDAYLNRFVIARKFHFEDVLLMIKTHIEWFKSFSVSEITDFRFTELDEFRALYPHGYHGVDRQGRPVYIERYSKMNVEGIYKLTTMDRVCKYWVQGYEKLLYERFPACPTSNGQSCVILDMSGVRLGMFDSRAREFLKMVSKISSDNYPETLGILFVANVPSFFSVLYSVAKPMIPADTKKKIHVLTPKRTKEELLKYISADQLPEFLGGTCRCSSSPADDHGCLQSDRGPWNTGPEGDFDDFVSCYDGEIANILSFRTVDHFVDPIEPRKRSWFTRLFTCGKLNDI